MLHSSSLDKDEKGQSICETKFRVIIEFLLYLTSRKPNIIFIIRLYTRFQTYPKQSRLIAVKRIFRYLVGTNVLGL